jgi:hypothetical protein
LNTAENMQTMKKMVGTVGWSAPELMMGHEFTAKVKKIFFSSRLKICSE